MKRNPFHDPAPAPIYTPWPAETLKAHDAMEADDVPMGVKVEIIAGHLTGIIVERVHDPRPSRVADDGQDWWPRFRKVGGFGVFPGSMAPFTPVRVV